MSEIRVIIDRPKCAGYANCLEAAPEVFDLDAEDVAVTLAESYPESDRALLENAARRCPAKAITLA